MQLKSLQRQVLDQFVKDVEASNSEERFAIVLIGSAVRRTDNRQSDLDLLLVSDHSLVTPRFHPEPLHVQTMRKDQLLGSLESGDDFVAWSLRFGVPIRGRNYWKSIKDSSQAKVWPKWHRKIPQAARRLAIARSLLKIEDLTSAAEETLYSVGHTARALLLKDKVFPRSKSEMVAQLKQVGWPHLADLLGTLLRNGAERRSLSRTQDYLKKLLLNLDKPAYNKFASLRKKTAEQKNILTIDPLARPAVVGHMRILLMLRKLVDQAAQSNDVHINTVEIRPAWSHEDDDRSRVTMDIQVDTEPERRFIYWEAVSDKVDLIAVSLSPRHRHFVNSSLSILVSCSHVF